jgi:hypothetical protein
MTTFTSVFGDDTIPPADQSYRAVALTADVTLGFPSTTDGEDIVAAIMDVTASSGPFAITLPPATNASVGVDFLVNNVGASSFLIKDNAGNTLATVAAGETKFFYLAVNTTAAGTWRVFTYGTGTSGADASALAGQGLTVTSSTLSAAGMTNTTASDLVLNVITDRAEVYVFTGGSVDCTLPSVATAGNGWFVDLTNQGTGAITVDNIDGALIDGATDKTLAPTESARFYTDGTAWYTIGYGRSSQFVFTKLVKDVSSGSPFTLTAAEASNKLFQFIGTVSGNVTVNVPTVVSIYYVQCAFSGAFTLTLKTAAGTGVALSNVARSILYCDGTNVVDAQTVPASTILAMTDGSVSFPALYFTTDTDTGIYKANTDSFGIAAGGVASAIFTTTGINSTAIGATSPSTGAFTTLTASTPLSPANGGTGIASYTIGDIIYASGTTAFSKLTAVATGNALISGGVSTAPAWGKIGLTTHVSGILPGANGGTNNGFFDITGPASTLKTFTFPNASATVLTSNAAVTAAQGGTGLATLTANNLLVGAGTSNVTFIAPGTSGNYLKSNGTTFASTAPGAYTANGFTMATSRLLGRTTASTGAVEELTVGNGLTLASGSIIATARTWQSVLGSRASATNYTNSTGTTIQVAVAGTCTTSSAMVLLVDGANIVWYQGGNSAPIQGSVIVDVPPGSVYRLNITGSPTINSWMELRP